jgi:hypothetical protein
MKLNQKYLSLLTLALLGVLFCLNVRAASVRIDEFAGYSSGTLGSDATRGTLNGWNQNTAQITLTNGSGSLDGTSLGLVASAGDRVFQAAYSYTNTALATARNQIVPNGTFQQPNETNIYYSMLYKFINASDVPANGAYLAQVFRANSGTGTPQHWALLARNVAGQIQLGVSKAGAPNNVTNFSSVNINAGQTVFVVLRQHIIPAAGNDVYDLWINPPPQYFGTNEVDIPPSDVSVGSLATDGTEDASTTGPGRLAFFAGPSCEWDELRVATTWAEVTPWFGQCLSAGFGSQPLSVTNSAEIGATFSATAIGTSPTIQWQRSTDGGTSWADIAGATASLYTTPNLAMSDNGSKYRAIANVACNNSFSTSSVATVTLIAPTPTPVGQIMNDTFTDPDLGFDQRNNEPVTPTNSVWWSATGDGTPGLEAFNQGGNMLGTPITNSSSLWLGYFTTNGSLPVHLAVGKAIKVTLPFTVNGYTFHLNNSSLRIGLFDYYDGGTRVTIDGAAAGGSRGNGIGVRGYLLNLDFGPTFSANSPVQLLARNFLLDDNLMGSISDFDSFGSGPAGGGYVGASAFQAGTLYTLEFKVERTDVNTCILTADITGGGTNWSHSITDTNYAYHRFDAFALRPNSLETTADSITFPEFLVDVSSAVIPVPPFSITASKMVAPGSFAITWDSVNGVNYQVQSRATLSTGNWATNATVLANGASTSYTNTPATSTTQFFRVVATP